MLDRLRDAARANPAVAGLAAVVVLVGAGVLGWLFQPWQLFLDDEVSEDFPVVGALASVDDMPEDVVADDADRALADDEMAEDEEADDPMPMESTAAADTEAEAVPVAVVGGQFADRSHPASGSAVIYRLPDGSHVLRIEDLETDNGPDLFVYLSTAAPDAPAGEFDDEFVNLGRLKGNIGDQNYELPADVDPTAWASVVIWCDRFDVAFGSAPLAPA